MTSPRNARSKPGGGRAYVWRNAAGEVETFPSVTTILGRVLAKPALPAWAARSCAEYTADNLGYLYNVSKSQGREGVVELVRQAPWTIRDRAADRGTLVHALAEAATLGAEVTVPEAVEPYFRQWRRWRDEFSPTFLMSEATVYSRRRRYAGTLDAVCEIDGLGTVLLDYKTGADIYPEAALQLAAYRGADFVGLPYGMELPIPDVEGAYVLRLAPDDYDFCRMADDVGDAWWSVLALYEWSLRDDLIGPGVGGGKLVV